MQVIISGTSTERAVRTILLMALVDCFTVAYLWDGYVGYARKNANEFVRLLGLPTEAAPPMHAQLTTAEGRRLAQQARSGDELSVITSVLGKPGLEHGGDAYFLGAGGWLKAKLAGGRIASVAWTDGPKTESDQQWQRWIGYALAVGGLIAAVRLALVLTTRLSLTDDGLWIGPRRLIPFDAITALPADPAGRLGCVELQYTRLGRLTRVRLDRYVYKRLPEITAKICERKGFPNPWPASSTTVGGA
jgi:hypothetical protein